MTNWKQNLAALWFSQFLSICGFSLVIPFAPFFIQHLGVTDPAQVKFWSAMSLSSTAIGLGVMAPIWGSLADRYGRRIMILRANFAAVIVLAGMSLSPNVQVFILCRFLQGFFTGTISASTAFVAGNAPNERLGFALGLLSTAQYTGMMAGPLAGGILAETLGYRPAFALAAAMLLAAGVIVFCCVRENFVRPVRGERGVADDWRLWVAMPILGLVVAMAAARTFDQPVIALYVQEIHGSLAGASILTGALTGLGGVGSVLAGLILGRVADRVSPRRIGTVSAMGAGIASGLSGLVPSFAVLFPARFLLAFCGGGLEPVLQIWLSRSTPERKRATVLGWAVTARSLGWALAPLVSGGIAVALGLRAVLLAGAVVFLLLIPLIEAVGRVGRAARASVPIAPAEIEEEART